MSILGNLKLVNVTRGIESAPHLRLRNKVIAALKQQRDVVQAELEGREHFIVARRHTKNETGEKVLVERQKRPRKWYWQGENGAYYFHISLGYAPVVLANGHKTVEVETLKGLPEVIGTLIEAVSAGELDEALKGNLKSKPVEKKAAVKKAQ